LYRVAHSKEPYTQSKEPYTHSNESLTETFKV